MVRSKNNNLVKNKYLEAQVLKKVEELAKKIEESEKLTEEEK